MNAFLPDNTLTVARLLALFTVELVAGFALQYIGPGRHMRLRAWILAVAALGISHQLTLLCPAGFRMLALIGAGFLGMKAVVSVSVRTAGAEALSLPYWLAFAVLWPGMDPKVFAIKNPEPLQGPGKLAREGFICLILGAALMAASPFMWRETHSTFAVTILFFVGSSLLVHYGFFTFAAGFWRRMGFDCDRVFKNPFAANNLGEFWGKQWNLAFKDMTAIAVYRPLSGVFPQGEVLLVSFTLSGLLHEVAISLPVMAGFGLPLAYFLLHGSLVALERYLLKKGFAITGWPGRLWVIFWLVLPLPILFHKPFLAGVVWPLIGINP